MITLRDMQMKYNCELEARSACGRTLFYPINDAAKQFSELVKCETLTRLHIKRIRALGFEVKIYYITNGNAMLCPDQVEDERIK